jgi:hypothetical protein
MLSWVSRGARCCADADAQRNAVLGICEKKELTDYSAGSSKSLQEMGSGMSIDFLVDRGGGVDGKAIRKRVR